MHGSEIRFGLLSARKQPLDRTFGSVCAFRVVLLGLLQREVETLDFGE